MQNHNTLIKHENIPISKQLKENLNNISGIGSFGILVNKRCSLTALNLSFNLFNQYRSIVIFISIWNKYRQGERFLLNSIEQQKN